LRSVVSLSAITGKTIEVINIRSKRQNSGVRPQYMFAIRKVASLFHTDMENLLFESDWIRFIPKSDKFEESMIKIDVGVAGSIPMILQTVIPAISLSGKSLSIEITSGTNVKMSLTTDYLQYIIMQAYREIGVCSQLSKHVAERQISSVLLKLENNGVHCRSYSSSFETSLSPGSSVLVHCGSDFGPYIDGDSIGGMGKLQST
jgi:RNA 3'-terminal phosphate cyclase (ATP)